MAAANRVSPASSDATASPPAHGNVTALVLASLAVLLAAAASVTILAGRGDDDTASTPPGILQGSFTSPFREGPGVPRARGTALRSTLTISGSTYKLTSGIYGLLGETRTTGDTVEFHSPTGYFKLPGLTSAASTPPDPANHCPGARGLYRWHTDGHTLRFSAVRDPCTGRQHQLEAAAWTPSQ